MTVTAVLVENSKIMWKIFLKKICMALIECNTILRNSNQSEENSREPQTMFFLEIDSKLTIHALTYSKKLIKSV